MYLIVIIEVLLLEPGEGVPDLLEEPGCLPPHSRVLTTEHVDCTRRHVLMNGIVSVDTFVLFHHEDLWVHLRFLEGVTSHLGLEFCRRNWIDTFDVLEGGIDFLVLHLSLIFHEVVRLLMQEFQPVKDHIKLLLREVLLDCLVDVMRKLVNKVQRD